MTSMILCLLMVGGAVAQSFNPVGYIPPHQLSQVDQFRQRVLNEKTFLADKISMLKMQNVQFQNKLDNITSSISSASTDQASSTSQTVSLEILRDKMIELLIKVGDLEDTMAGELSLSSQQEQQVNTLWNRIRNLEASQHQQGALLNKAATVLEQSREKLADIANDTTDTTSSSCSGADLGLSDNCNLTSSFADFLKTRRCEESSVTVHVDPMTSEGSQMFNFTSPELFAGKTPTVFCAASGFESALNIGKSSAFSFGFGSYADVRQNLKFTLDCKAFPDSVLVKIFDLSRGQNTQVKYMFVSIKACTFGPQAGLH